MFVKICTLLIVFAVVANAAPSDRLRKIRETDAVGTTQAESTNLANIEVSNEEWENYKKTFNKSYTDAADEAERRAIYLDTKKFVAEHNQKYAEGKSSFTVGINQFADRKPNERYHHGLIRRKDRKLEQTE